MKIGLWSTTAGNNNSTPPDGFPEGQAPSTLNDCAREVMAAVRTYAQDAEWFDHGMSPTFVNTASFTIPGDQTGFIKAGRQLKLYDGGNTYYRQVGGVSYTTVTTVSLGTGTAITNSLSSFAIGIISPTNSSLPSPASFNYVPAGTVIMYAANAAPSGYIECNGTAVSRTVYAGLFAAIGTVFGPGDSATTFNVPQLQGEFIRVWDNGRGVDTGRTFGSAQAGANAAHVHTLIDTGHAHTITDPGHAHVIPGFATAGGVGADVGVQSGTQNTGTVGTNITINSTTTGITMASSGGAEARPRNIALLACIKT